MKAVILWEAAGPGIIYASFKTKKAKNKLNTSQCYPPTKDKDDETKAEFYNNICVKRKESDTATLMGDSNAKIISDNSEYEEVMSRSLGQ